MSIEYAFPPDLVMADNLKREKYRPGMRKVRLLGGGTKVRDFSSGTANRFTFDLTDLTDDTTKLRQLEEFAEHVDFNLTRFWLLDVNARFHRGLLCDTVGDGTRTTFMAPVVPTDAAALTAMHVFQGATPQFSGYTSHILANLLTDDQASAVDGTTGSKATGTYGSLSQDDMVAAHGLNCLKVESSSAGTHGVTQTNAYMPAATVGQEYTAHAVVRGTGNLRVGIAFFDNTQTIIGSWNWSDAVTGSLDEWQVVTKAATAPANTVTAKVWAQCNTSNTVPFFADCLGLIPGDCTRWFLPSVAPCLIEFSSAPSSNTRVKADCQGQVMTLVKLINDSLEWKEVLEGDALVKGLIMEQDFE